MYYQIARLGETTKVVNIRNIQEYEKYESKGYDLRVVRIEAIKLRPETMRQGDWGCQAFKITDTNGKVHSFFNIDEFPKLAEAFKSELVLIYNKNRGGTNRSTIVGYIDASGNKKMI